MATPRKAAPDPLTEMTEELPPVPEEPCPSSSDEVEFTVSIIPRVNGGRVLWDWEILGNTLAQHVGDYTGLKSDKIVQTYYSAEEAETDARDYVQRIRNAIDLKLKLPLARKLTL